MRLNLILAPLFLLVITSGAASAMDRHPLKKAEVILQAERVKAGYVAMGHKVDGILADAQCVQKEKTPYLLHCNFSYVAAFGSDSSSVSFQTVIGFYDNFAEDVISFEAKRF